MYSNVMQRHVQRKKGRLAGLRGTQGAHRARPCWNHERYKGLLARCRHACVGATYAKNDTSVTRLPSGESISPTHSNISCGRPQSLTVVGKMSPRAISTPYRNPRPATPCATPRPVGG